MLPSFVVQVCLVRHTAGQASRCNGRRMQRDRSTMWRLKLAGSGSSSAVACALLAAMLAIVWQAGRAWTQTTAPPDAAQQPGAQLQSGVVPPIKRVAPRTPPLPAHVAAGSTAARQKSTAAAAKNAASGKAVKKGKRPSSPGGGSAAGATRAAIRCATGLTYDPAVRACTKGTVGVATGQAPMPTAGPAQR